MKGLIELYKKKLQNSKDVVNGKLEDSLLNIIFDLYHKQNEDLILALETVNNELVDLKRSLEIKTQDEYYFKCDECETIFWQDNANPSLKDLYHTKPDGDVVCDSESFTRLSREEYLDYFGKYEPHE